MFKHSTVFGGMSDTRLQDRAYMAFYLHSLGMIALFSFHSSHSSSSAALLSRSMIPQLSDS